MKCVVLEMGGKDVCFEGSQSVTGGTRCFHVFRFVTLDKSIAPWNGSMSSKAKACFLLCTREAAKYNVGYGTVP
jgi:hypothetical protein